jgi:membrane-bound ClpP family serine protease
MQKFWELFRESVIVQALITLCLVGTVCYLVATGQEVPELLSTALMLVLGFYFGSKVQQQITKLSGG